MLFEGCIFVFYLLGMCFVQVQLFHGKTTQCRSVLVDFNLKSSKK